MRRTCIPIAALLLMLTAAAVLSQAAGGTGSDTTWTVTSTYSDTNSGGTEHISITSDQTSSDGQQIHDSQTMDRSPDGSTHETQDIVWTDANGNRTENHATSDTDQNGNQTVHIEDSVTDPDGNRTTTITDETFDRFGNRTSSKTRTEHDKVAPPKEPQEEKPEHPPKPPRPENDNPTPPDAAGPGGPWHGTIVIERKSSAASNSTSSGVVEEHKEYSGSEHRSQTYSDFQLSPENEEGKSWLGAARVNVTIDASSHEVHKVIMQPPGVPKWIDEWNGADIRTAGAVVDQGSVQFWRLTDQEDNRKTKCSIQVDALRHGGGPHSPPPRVPITGRRWKINKMNGPKEERDVNEWSELEASFTNFSFECDPKADSYSGQRSETSQDGHETVTYKWNLSR